MASKELQQTVLQRARASQARKGSMGIDMDSSEGLLNLADQAGLGENARRALEPHSGVSGKFLSGGWISDTMDILNASIYGVAGMAKGKTFIQGVEDRDSFSDVDMLGKYGTSGKIAGFIADIALDPLNYVPVFGWAKGAAKATGFARVFGNMSSKVVGELKTISIGEGTAEAADVTIRVGGMSVVRALGDSFVYGFGSSRKAYDSIQLAYGRAESVAANSTNLLENFSKMPANAKKNILKFAEDGSVQTINRDEALRLFSGDELKHTLGVLDAKQDLVTRLVKEGGVSKEVAERDFDSYLTQQYDDVIEARISKPGQGSYPTSGSVNYKARKDLTPEERTKLGQVTDPDLLLSGTFLKMNKQYLDNSMSNALKRFAVTEAQLGEFVAKGGDIAQLKKVENINKYKTRAKEFELKNSIKETSNLIKPALKELREAFKGNEAMSKEIDALEGWIDGLKEAGTEAYQDVIDSLNTVFRPRVGVGEVMGEADKSTLKFGKERFKELVGLAKKIESGKSEVAGAVGKRAEIQSAMVKLEQKMFELSESRDFLQKSLRDDAMSQLSGSYLPKGLYDMMKELTEPSEALGRRLVQPFKKATVVWNPPAIARNALTAITQNWFKLGIGALNPKDWADAAKHALDPTSPIVKEMGEHGLHLGSGQITEFAHLMVNKYTQDNILKQLPESAGVVGNSWNAVKKYGKGVDKFMQKAYAFPDNVAKISVYLHQIKRGVSPEQAVRQAYAATFNYSEVTPFVLRMRQAIWGVPFITFSLKAAPQLVETAVKTPTRLSIFGKIHNDLIKASGAEGQEEQSALPDYMREGFYLKLPFKDEDGNSAYFDLSHIIPYGSLMDGSFFKDPVSQQPVLNLVREFSKNETFYGNKIWKEGMRTDEKLARMALRIGTLFTPALVDENILPDGYDSDGNLVYNGPTGDIIKKQRGEIEEDPEYWRYILKQMALNTKKFDVEKQIASQEYAKKEAVAKVLVDNGILKDFTNIYLPEDSPLRPTLDKGNPRPLGR